MGLPASVMAYCVAEPTIASLRYSCWSRHYYLDILPTNSQSGQALRASVIPWKVTCGFRSDFGWMSRFRYLARDYERLPETLAAELHILAFAILMLKNVAEALA